MEEEENKALTTDEVNALREQGILVLDTRQPQDFAEGFIPGSLHVAMGRLFTHLMQEMVFTDQALVLVTDPGQEPEVVKELTDAGFDNIRGYLEGGWGSWQAADKPVDMVIGVSAEELAIDHKYSQPLLIDLREEAAFEQKHVERSQNLPLHRLPLDWESLPQKQGYVYGSQPEEGLTAVSYLKKQGRHQFYWVEGAWDAVNEWVFNRKEE